MSNKILKRDRESFIKFMNEFIKKHCNQVHVRTASDCIEAKNFLPTIYGIPYRVHEPEADILYTVCGRFEGNRDDFARLIKLGIDCNPFTGKWNFHLSGENTPDVAAAHIIRKLRSIKQKENEYSTLYEVRGSLKNKQCSEQDGMVHLAYVMTEELGMELVSEYILRKEFDDNPQNYALKPIHVRTK